MFDDEKLADEKSIANMKLKYAGLTGKNVKVLSETKDEEIGLKQNLLKGIKKTDCILNHLKKFVCNEELQIIDELQNINYFEMSFLEKDFNLENFLKTENPEVLTMPNSVRETNFLLAKNEIENIKLLLSVFKKEAEEQKEKIEKVIQRRLDEIKNYFL